ncbi:hypothetical protein JST56_00615 [Candidatus Dependentiae bacterium]|nr:hypothetical protein [Candidatus Dependentiae bacterium]
MNFRIILTLLLIAYSTQVSAAPKRRSMSSRKGDENGKELEKKDEQRFKVKVPTPRNLSSTERRIAKIFSDDVIPIAQGLSQIAGGKEVQTAREAKIKLREQKAQTALRSRTATGRHRHASTPSSRGGGFGGTSWGGGGYRPSGQGGYGWGGGGGYRPTPNYGTQSSYSPSSSWGQSSPTSYGSPSSSRGLTTTKAAPFGTDTDSSKTGEPKKSYSSSSQSSKKYAKNKDSLMSTHKEIVKAMENINEKADEATDIQEYYKGQLGIIGRLVDKFKIHEKAYGNLSQQDKLRFDQEVIRAKSTVEKFLSHLVCMIVYPTSDAELQTKQDDARGVILDNLKNLCPITPIVATQITAIKDYYDKKTDAAYKRADTEKKKTPPQSIAAADQKDLEQARDSLKLIQNNFEKKFSDPTNSSSPLVKPTEIKNLYDKIVDVLK